MNVIICDNNASNLSSAKSAIKGKVETIEMDVSKVEDFEKLKAKVEKEFGGTLHPVSPLNGLMLSVEKGERTQYTQEHELINQ